MIDMTTLLRTKGKCCITELPMSTSGSLNLVELPFKATWKYPVVGNVLTGEGGYASAVVHDLCIQDNQVVGKIKFAIEFSGDDIIYHPVNLEAPAL